MKYSKGPWLLDADRETTDGSKVILDYDGLPVARTDGLENEKEDFANGCLIAAATEMLEALEGLAVRFKLDPITERTTIRNCFCNQFLDTRFCRHVAALRAIKKAKGKI